MKRQQLIFCIITLILGNLPTFCFAQNFEWLKTYGTKGAENIYGICSDANGGYSALIVNDSFSASLADTLHFGKFKFVKSAKNETQSFIVKADSNGNIIKALYLGDFNATSLCQDNNGNLYLSGVLSKMHRIGNDTFSHLNGKVVFIKYDNKLNLVWVTQSNNDKPFPKNEIHTAKKQSPIQLSYSDGHLLFISFDTGFINIGNQNYSFNQTPTYFYGELNNQNGKIIWSNYLYKTSKNSSLIVTGIIRHQNQLFIFGSNISSDIILIKSDTFFKYGGYIAELDSIGNYVKRFEIHNNKNVNINDLTADNSNLYFCGSFTDSLKWGNQIISPEYQTGGANGIHNELFAAAISKSFDTKWFFRPKIIDNSWGGNNRLEQVLFSNGFLYFGGQMDTKLSINSQVLSPVNSFVPDVLLLKIDPIGNLLWATNGTASFAQNLSLAVFDNRSVLAGGTFINQIRMGKLSDSSNGKNYADVWITKITDYDITRGQVKSGPYCAGDTIWVPYTHIGTFDTSNVFIAELSDEYGNFNGGHRELGRLKTNQDSTIAGLLPLFQVSSSLKYRIRVRSTAPAIQSYFLLDTLRLLIYSRDKANPGPTLSICYRDTVQLSTFGGTRWTWSPQYLMNDSTLRQPLVWPERDTVYQIIISDSSGCGAPDTAYKTVLVKQRPVLVGDTLYNKCEGKNIRLRLFTQNTDSLGYRVVWYQNNKPFFFNDSLLYVQDASAAYKAVLTDFCSPVKDTISIKVNYLGPLRLLAIKDTVVCANTALTLFAKGTGGQKADYQFSWYNKQRTFIGNGFPTVNITESDTFKVILRDGCSAFSDSALWVVGLADKINTQKDMGLPKDTVFCSAFSLGLKIKNTHADDAIAWVDINTSTALGTTDSLTVFKPSSIEAAVKNSCGITKDTLVVKQLAAPKIKLDSLYDACENINLMLTIGNKQNEEKLLWSTTDTTATITITKAGNYWAKAANYCGVDSVGFEVLLYPQPQCDFVVSDVCEGERFVFNNQTTGGKTFQWRFGDGNNSSDSAPAHQYAVTRTSRTYFVTLVASISTNCSDSISQPLNVNATADAGFSFSNQANQIFFTPKTNDANNTYQWHFGDDDSSTQINPVHQYKADSGVYNVCLTIINSANCKSQVCEQVRYSVGMDGIGINTLGFSIYPNPTNGIINLQFEQNQGAILIEVYNSLGEKVFTKKQLQGTNCELNLSGMSEGVYWVRVETDFGVGYKKVVRIERLK